MRPFNSPKRSRAETNSRGDASLAWRRRKSSLGFFPAEKHAYIELDFLEGLYPGHFI